MSLVSTGNVSKRSLTRCLCHNLKSPNTVPKPTRYYLFDGNAILWTFCASANSTLITCMHKNRLVMNVCYNCHNNWQNNYAENDFKWWGHFWKLYRKYRKYHQTEWKCSLSLCVCATGPVCRIIMQPGRLKESHYQQAPYYCSTRGRIRRR